MLLILDCGGVGVCKKLLTGISCISASYKGESSVLKCMEVVIWPVRTIGNE